ncbi:diguanylate cyclase [Hahella sp. KA22]|uniref:diguanylate cyclase n=1 Tax=Hahella sp. KA22 TaxID=1628392 RepID=UPI000FDDECD8|nr:diguanylate cyclase [Hahella sp. KA22]AZZ91735.1 diguanylate cyclase [Hahella sp. KA22]QAY55105.1 diguanylate cyclase [Hahella sp. KA22]
MLGNGRTKIKALPLKASLTLVFGCLMLALTALLTGVIGSLARETQVREQSAAIEALAQQVADKLDRSLYERYRDLSTAASITTPDGPLLQNKKLARVWLSELKQRFPLYAWIGYANMEGKVQVSAGGMLEGADVSARPWFQHGLIAPYFGDVHKALLLANLMPTREEPWRFVDVSIPIKSADGQVQGVLGAHLSWDWAEQLSLQALQPHLKQRPAEALIIDDEGTVLMGPPSLAQASLPIKLPSTHSTEPTSFVSAWPGEGEFLNALIVSGGFEHLKNFQWRILIRQSVDEAFGEIQRLQGEILLWGLLFGVVFIALVWRASIWITRPLSLLSQSAARFAKERALTPPPQAFYREGVNLAASLGAMMNDIASHEQELTRLNQSLEQRVHQRTQELSDSLKVLEASERKLKTITDNLPVLVAYADRQERYQFNNAVYKKWLSLEPQDLHGRTIAEILGAARYSEAYPHIQKALAGQYVSFEIHQVVDDRQRHYEVNYIPDSNTHGDICGFFIMIADITEHKEHEKGLRWQLQHDHLTGALNRQGLKTLLELAVDRAGRSRTGIAVMFLDLDHFKSINDTYGHDAGDVLLRATADRLMMTVRKTDSIARIAGDEFVAVLETITHPKQDAAYIANKIHTALQEPVLLSDGRHIHVTASIGVAVAMGNRSLTPEKLVARADEAMYQAKRQGRNAFVILAMNSLKAT